MMIQNDDDDDRDRNGSDVHDDDVADEEDKAKLGHTRNNENLREL